MQVYLLKAFRFVEVENLPYRKDGKGGNVFHGVGSHIMLNNLRHRQYRMAFEVATMNQPQDCHLIKHRLRMESGGTELDTRSHEMVWRPENRHQTQTPELSAYQWNQYIEIDVEQPSLITIHIDMIFSDSQKWRTVEGAGRLVVDTHPVAAPVYYSKPMWYLRRILRLPHEAVKTR